MPKLLNLKFNDYFIYNDCKYIKYHCPVHTHFKVNLAYNITENRMEIFDAYARVKTCEVTSK